MQIRYSSKIKDRIISLLDEDFNYTISDICAMIGVSRKTFYKWKKDIPEFARELEEAIDRNHDATMDAVRVAVKKKLEGCRTTQTRIKYTYTEDGEWVPKEKTVTSKDCPPDNRTIKMMLDREDQRREKLSAVKSSCPPIQITVPTEKDVPIVERFLHKLQNGSSEHKEQQQVISEAG